MHIIKDYRIKDLVDRFVPGEVLQLNPVVAGGFAVWVFKTLELLDELNIDWPIFLESLDKKLNRRDLLLLGDHENVAGSNVAVIANDKKYFFSINFNDVDLWFISDEERNRLHNERHYHYTEDHQNYIFSSEKWFRVVHDKVSLVSKAGKRYMEEPFPNDKAEIVASTDWANSYRVKFGSRNSGFSFVPEAYRGIFSKDNREHYIVNVQFIKQPIDSLEGLFSRFDMVNCSAAIYQNELHIDDSCMQAYAESKIIMNKEIEKSLLLERMQRALRAFKYIRRYSLDVEDEYALELFHLYLEIFDHPLIEKVKELSNSNGVWGPAAVLSPPDSYVSLFKKGDVESPPENKLLYTIEKLVNCFSAFVQLESFDPFWVSYFLNTEIKKIDEIIERVLYQDKTSNLKKGA